LYERDLHREKWTDWLSSQLQISTNESIQCLQKGVSDTNTQRMICEHFGLTLEELMFSELYHCDRNDLLSRNVRMLLSSLKHGEHKEIAEKVNVDLTTISKWKRGVRPREEHLVKIQHYFKLSTQLSLTLNHLYLELDPITSGGRKDHLLNLMNNASVEVIEKHYASLLILLNDDA